MRSPARSASLPPSVGGWDALNSLQDMPKENAVVLDNFFPDTDRVELRFGFDDYSTGMSGNVDTLMHYHSPAGTEKLFAANGTSIFDVTAGGAVGAASVTGLTGIQFQSTQISTPGGHYLFAVNGVDTPRTFDGSAWAVSTVTGPTIANLIWCNLHQRRLWFGEKNSLDAWYLDPTSITGAASTFPIGDVAKLGGYLVGMGTWTRDAGDGADDAAVFITSEGEAIVYQGTDPDSATTWALVGVFRIGEPIGRRSIIKAGADLVLITQDGFLSASTILQADRSQTDRVAISKQINKAVNDAVQDGQSLFGWQPFIYPKARMMIFNVPTSATASDQYVFNTITGAPCRFTGINARCWVVFGDSAYFGGTDGKVYKFDPAYYSDNGANIVGDMLPAFSYLGQTAVSKSFKRAEVIFQSNGDPFAAIELNVDFQIKRPSANPVASPTTSARWGISKWGVGTWGASNQVYSGWRGMTGNGRAVSTRVRVDTTTVRPSIVAININYVSGGIV